MGDTTRNNFRKFSNNGHCFISQKIIFSYFYFYFFLLAHSWNSSCLLNFRMTSHFCNSSHADVKALQQLFLLLKELDLVMFRSLVMLNNTNIEEVQNPIVGAISIFNLLCCELFIFFNMHIKFMWCISNFYKFLEHCTNWQIVEPCTNLTMTKMVSVCRSCFCKCWGMLIDLIPSFATWF